MRRSALAVGVLVAGAVIAHGCGSGGSSGASPAGTTSAGVSPTTTSAQPTAQPSPGAPARTKTAVVVARYGEGFLEQDGATRILHVKGTAYERGLQYGYLAGDHIEGLMGALPAYMAQKGNALAASLQGLVTPAGALIYRPYFDADALEEIRGIIDGNRRRNPASFLVEADLIFLNAIIDLGATLGLDVLNCSSLAVWGPRTQGGKLFQTRCVDLMVGSGLEDHTLVVINKPQGGVPYINLGWAGLIGVASGMNAHGLGVGQVWAFSNEKQIGHPWSLATRQILGSGASVDDAVQALALDRRTYGSNFVFADRGDTRGGVPRAIALEVTANRWAKFESDDPKEDLAQWNGQPYGIRLPFACFRGDAALDPTIRSLQTASNGPSGDPRTASAYRDRYLGQAQGILHWEQQGVPMGKDEVIWITQQVAMRRSSLQCCVYDNTELEVWVSDARIDSAGGVHYAYQEPYRQVSLDYYTPTATLVPDKTAARVGEPVQVAVAFETLGKARRLELRLSLELGGLTIPLGASATLDLPERGRGTAILTAALPAALPNVGLGHLSVDVVEAGTQDLVEIARTGFTVLP